MNRKYFYLGLILFYLLIFFASHKLVYFSAYFITTFFFYLSTRKLTISLIYSLILSLFSEIGLAASLFIMEPKELNLGSGYLISPTTLILLFLIPASLFTKKSYRFEKADVFLMLFYLWTIVSFFLWPLQNVFLGLLQLSELMLVYYVLRIHLSYDIHRAISLLLISMIVFQTLIGGIQIVLQRPYGTVAESVNVETPYGIVASEDENVYRVTGTFAHPNLFGAFLLALSPFLFYYPFTRKLGSLIKLLFGLSLVFTFSRAVWIFFISFLLYFWRRKKQWMIGIAGLTVVLLLSSVISGRLTSIPQAFEEGGSMSVRFKLFEEGLTIVKEFPLFGVGLNRSLEYYAYTPVTDIFTIRKPDAFYKIHNTFLEIATEIGLPGLLFFILFLINVFNVKRDGANTIFYSSSRAGLFLLIAIVQLHPFFHASPFRWVFLLTPLILLHPKK